MEYDFERAMDIYKEAREREMDMLSRMTPFEKLCYKRNKAAQEAENREKNAQLREKEQEMTEKQYAQGIYIKKFTGQYGEWLSVAVRKPDGNYQYMKFYPKKEQKNDKYIDFYGVLDDWKPEKKQEEENIVKFNESEEIPF